MEISFPSIWQKKSKILIESNRSAELYEGVSLLRIRRGPEADDILTRAGKTKWRSETLGKILQNGKCVGDVLSQKIYTVDFSIKSGYRIMVLFRSII